MSRETASLRPFRYLTVPRDDRERVHIAAMDAYRNVRRLITR
jgi:hypothetical protein